MERCPFGRISLYVVTPTPKGNSTVPLTTAVLAALTTVQYAAGTVQGCPHPYHSGRRAPRGGARAGTIMVGLSVAVLQQCSSL